MPKKWTADDFKDSKKLTTQDFKNSNSQKLTIQDFDYENWKKSKGISNYEWDNSGSKTNPLEGFNNSKSNTDPLASWKSKGTPPPVLSTDPKFENYKPTPNLTPPPLNSRKMLNTKSMTDGLPTLTNKDIFDQRAGWSDKAVDKVLDLFLPDSTMEKIRNSVVEDSMKPQMQAEQEARNKDIGKFPVWESKSPFIHNLLEQGRSAMTAGAYIPDQNKDNTSTGNKIIDFTSNLIGQGVGMASGGLNSANNLLKPASNSAEFLAAKGLRAVKVPALVNKLLPSALGSGVDFAAQNMAQTTMQGGSLKDTAVSGLEGLGMGSAFGAGVKGLELAGKSAFPGWKTTHTSGVEPDAPTKSNTINPKDLSFKTKGIELKQPKIDYENIHDMDFLQKHIADLETAMTKADEPTKLDMNLQLFAAKERLKKLQSQFRSNTIARTTALTDEEKNLINPKEFDYVPQTAEGWSKEAERKVNTDMDSEMQRISNQSSLNGGVDAHEAALISIKLRDEARQTGNYTKLIKWLKTVASKTRETARALKGTDTAWEKKSVDGAITDAARVVDNVEDGLKKTNPKLLDEVDKETKDLQDALDNAKKQAADELEKKLPEELLANKVSSTVKEPKQNKPNLINDMVNELFRVAKESPLPEKVAKAKRSPLEFLEEAVSNKGQYGDVWEKAKAIVKDKYKDDPEALQALEDYFSKGIVPQYSNTTVNNSIKVSIKNLGQTLDSIARASKGDKNEFLKQLAGYISRATGATGEDALVLANRISENYNKLVAEKSQSILKQMFKEVKPKEQKNLLQKVQELINLGAYDNDAIRDLIKQKKGLPVLTARDIEYITEHMEKAKAYPEGSLLQRGELSLVEKLISNKQPKSAGDKIKAFRKNMMLLNPVTLVTRNPGSNVLLGGAENVKDIPGTLIDKLVSKKTGIRTTGLPEYGVLRKGNLTGAKRGLEEFQYDLKNGTDTARSRGQMEIAKGDTFKNPILNKIDKVVNLGLQIGDRPFFESAFEGRINELMKLNKVTEPTEDMIKDAMNIALERVLQNDSKLSHLGGNLRRAVNDATFNGVGDFILPFTQTPGNVLDKTLDYSPIGLARSLGTAKKLKNFVGTDAKFETSQLQKKMVDQAARGLVGTGLLAGGLLAGKSGAVTGKGDSNSSLNEFNKTIGKQNYSVKVGNNYVAYDWLQPLATPFAAGVDAGKEKSLGKGLASGVDTVFKQSFLKGVSNLFGNGSPAMGFYKTMLDIPKSFLPSVGGRISKTIDPLTRDTSDSNSLKAAAKGIVAQTPFSRMLPAKVDMYGKEVKNFGGNTNPLNTLLNPAYISKYQPTKTDNMLIDIFGKTSDASILPRMVDDKITYTDKQGKQRTIILTAAEKNALQKKIGQETKQKFDNVANGYSASTQGEAERAAKRLKSLKDDVWIKARNEFLKSKNIQFKQ